MTKVSKVIFKPNGKVKYNIAKKDMEHIGLVYMHMNQISEKLDILDRKVNVKTPYYFKVENGKVIRIRIKKINKCSKIFDNLVTESYMGVMENKI